MHKIHNMGRQCMYVFLKDKNTTEIDVIFYFIVKKKLLKNGISNGDRTRHIAIRFFFVADRVASEEIKIEYMPTGEMLADILTKPLQGALFKKLRDKLLNWY